MIKLRINQKKYYDNKKEFVKLYKKLGLQWKEDTDKGDIWGNPDNSIFLRKLPEEEEWKRFYAHNVPAMVEFLKSVGAEEVSEKQAEPVIHKVVEPFNHENYSGHKSFKELLESMPLNFGVKWGDELSRSSMSDDFKKRWRELQVKYKDYTVRDFYAEIEAKNERRRKEQGINKDEEKNEEVVINKKSDNDILPIKSRNKTVTVKPVKTKKVEVKEPFKKKVWIIKEKKVNEE